jgi:putative FmdB family regulatory protein
MPTYEYKCPAGHTFEKFYPTMKNSRRMKCPTCGKLAGRQISGGAGLVFKGSGFYITDYKRAGEKPEQKEEAKPAPESKPGTGTKPGPESKPGTESKSADSVKKKNTSGDK